jgi:hypothetical protein
MNTEARIRANSFWFFFFLVDLCEDFELALPCPRAAGESRGGAKRGPRGASR